MKILSVAEFEKLVIGSGWIREQNHEVVETIDTEAWHTGKDGEPEKEIIGKSHGWASLTSKFDGIEITYTETFNYDEFEPDTLVHGTEGQDNVWTVTGVTVISEYGGELNADELAEHLDSDFNTIDYSVLDIEQTDDIDIDEDSDTMETFTIYVDNQPNIRFTGELVASASSSEDRASGSRWSGDTGRWTELELYKTKGGKYVCQQIGRTRWQGERTRYSGKVCETLDEVFDFFGHRWLAKDLYDDAGLDATIDIE